MVAGICTVLSVTSWGSSCGEDCGACSPEAEEPVERGALRHGGGERGGASITDAARVEVDGP